MNKILLCNAYAALNYGPVVVKMDVNIQEIVEEIEKMCVRVNSECDLGLF